MVWYGLRVCALTLSYVLSVKMFICMSGCGVISCFCALGILNLIIDVNVCVVVQRGGEHMEVQ